jgi:hypothetical protein
MHFIFLKKKYFIINHFEIKYHAKKIFDRFKPKNALFNSLKIIKIYVIKVLIIISSF